MQVVCQGPPSRPRDGAAPKFCRGTPSVRAVARAWPVNPASEGKNCKGADASPYGTGFAKSADDPLLAAVLTTTLLLVGAVLFGMALTERDVKRLPLSTSIVYLFVGWGAASLGTAFSRVDPGAQASLLLPCTEVALLISLFATGMRLGMPSTHRAWKTATLLASVGMVASIGAATLVGVAVVGLSWAGALLLAAILAPTDPVLATEVQIHAPADRDAVRLSLTAEGGLNDGTAFPAVMLALGVLGVHELGRFGITWVLRDVLWAVLGGAALGGLLGRVLGAAVRARLRRRHDLGWDELLYLGVIALAYGLARALEVSTFLAVFVAGFALFHETPPARHAMQAAQADSSRLSKRLLAFGERCERLVEVAMVLFIGAALSWVQWRWQHVAYALLLIVLVRPLSVLVVTRGSRQRMPRSQERLIAWLGIRGVGSLFYLAYALTQPIDSALAHDLISLTVLAIAMSIVVHGVSATPLMSWHQRRNGR